MAGWLTVSVEAQFWTHSLCQEPSETGDLSPLTLVRNAPLSVQNRTNVPDTLHSITLDGHQPSHSTLRRMGMNGEFNFRGRNPVRIRCALDFFLD